MTERPYLVDKPVGATPLEALGLLRDVRGLPASTKLAYAGRLDPLASGLLVVLRGGLLQEQERFWHLPKEYDVTLLVGLTTDSHDLLGLPALVAPPPDAPERITGAVRALVGKQYVSVPVYSSWKHDGRPLFQWARESDGIPPAVPVRRMTVSQIDVHEVGTMTRDDLRSVVRSRIPLVRGDFRQDAISAAWERVLDADGQWPTIRLTIHCGSGTYVRSLAHTIGRRLGSGAVVTDLRRTRVGGWRVTDPGVLAPLWRG